MKRKREETIKTTAPFYIVGIDPQPSLFGVQCRDENKNRIAWFNHYLEKRQRFTNAQAWQEYIYKTAKLLITVIIPEKCAERLHGVYKPTYVGFEQQKGRVCSIVENALLNVLIEENIPRWIVNPMCWKKKTNIPCTKSHGGNKKVVMQKVKPDLDEFVNANYTEEEKNVLKKSKRTHDLCDADKITEATHLYYNEKFPPSKVSETTSSCEEKHLSLYNEVYNKGP